MRNSKRTTRLMGGVVLASVWLGCGGAGAPSSDVPGDDAAAADGAPDVALPGETGNDAASPDGSDPGDALADAAEDAPSDGTPSDAAEDAFADGAADSAVTDSAVTDSAVTDSAVTDSAVTDSAVTDTSPSDSATAPDADASFDAGCASDQKLCGATCTSKRDPAHGCAAGSCAPCAFPGATATCSIAGACALEACTGKFADCDGNAANGCEVDLGASDNEHCGGCGALCATGCEAGSCPARKPGAHVPDSAHAWCTDGAAAMICPTKGGEPAYGQDGSFELFVPKYVLTSRTVFDPITALVWERKPASTAMNQATAADYCTKLAKNAHGGFDDWRLPTIHELVSLVDHGGDTLAGGSFSGLDRPVWSSSGLPGVAGKAYSLVWADQQQVPFLRSTGDDAPTALCVRGAAPPGGMTTSLTGNLVSDARTGLVWQRKPFPTALPWEKALAYCNEVTLDEQTGFRLPTFKELWTTIDLSKTDPSQDPALEADMATFWTSSPWKDHFSDGHAQAFTLQNYGPSGPSATPLVVEKVSRVRCVKNK